MFARNELEIEAADENLAAVQAFVERQLAAAGCASGTLMQIAVAVEEIFINIAHYAYAPNRGMASIRVELTDAPASVSIIFTDHGVPYDPLAREDPDVTLPVGERQIGGLGIFLTKQLMDGVSYAYRDGKNILTLKKNL